MDTADMGFKTQEASDGLTMSGLIHPLGRKYLVSAQRPYLSHQVSLLGERGWSAIDRSIGACPSDALERPGEVSGLRVFAQE
jgi:hypothetical protein